MTARARGVRERMCRAAVTPEISTTTSLRISVVRQLELSLTCAGLAAMFQIPVVSAGRYYGSGNGRGVGAVGLGAGHSINALRWLEYVMCGLA